MSTSASVLKSRKVVVLGGGSVGSTLAKAISDSGMAGSVAIGARSPAKTTEKLLTSGLNLIVEESQAALKSANVVILATPSVHTDEAIKELAASLGDMTDKVVIDATNPLTEFPDGLQIRWKQGTSGGEVLAEALPTAKVYKSFNTVGVEHMKSALGKDMMFAGDTDETARAICAAIIAAVGFKPIFVGPIRYARNLEAMAELWIHMAIPPLPAETYSRKFWFSVSGDP
ncbi:coenzyme F420-dependent NADP oxidoreductase [Nitzschia inconspicua]|uniref:Coenzyme F420-dependent NADP oxidoreductase n=1 Tax=Nitzschia inconspicua TaxID=303405 RepID=A0A9K3Q6L8_9STRA|nr:coenzyme F420-dependent NADP oxidoreductase [Nitzschia inconspicua]